MRHSFPSLALRASASLLFVGTWAAIAQVPDENYKIKPRDVVVITVEGALNLGGEFPVRSSGMIDHPLLGTLPLADVTVDVAKARLVTRLEELYFQKGQAARRSTLRVRPGGSQRIRVLGEVESPSEYNLPDPPTLLQALLDAGGVKGSNAGVAQITRTAGNGLSDQIAVPLQPLLEGLDPRWNVHLRGNDVVVVPPATQLTVYMLGEFGAQGPLSLDNESATLLTAVIRAGGLSARAAKRLIIKRKRPDGTLVSEEYDYRAILKGRHPDVPLRDGDIIEATLSFF